MLKRKSILLGLVCFFCASNSMAATSITIKGYVRDNACAVSAESKDFTVDLMSHAAKQFHAVGAASLSVPFKIVLAPCGGAATAVKVGFNGVEDSDNSKLLKLDSGAAAARGMGVQILDATQVPLSLNGTQSTLPWISISPHQTNILSYYARIVATRVPVSAGRVSATAVFTLEFQ
ncbi:TPA: type 1 fimbrial protein [Pseudomonas aeruginosa]|nr:type 1 fimbrial protein [Pseudomonas aeruginosa]HEP8853935.1 type 1 fimbrial protein [Pseudomonas aeruginosa]